MVPWKNRYSYFLAMRRMAPALGWVAREDRGRARRLPGGRPLILADLLNLTLSYSFREFTRPSDWVWVFNLVLGRPEPAPGGQRSRRRAKCTAPRPLRTARNQAWPWLLLQK